MNNLRHIIIFVNDEEVINFCYFKMDVAPQNKFLENILTLTRQLGKSQLSLFVCTVCIYEDNKILAVTKY